MVENDYIDQFELIIDQSTIDQYNAHYFKKYPRRKKPPIARPIHESLNVWSIMNNIQRNNLKQRWKEFVLWYLNQDPARNLRPIVECDIRFVSYMPTRRRSDPDNMVPKFILDGVVESGLLVDDDSLHLRNLILSCSYDKDRPRTEMTFYIRKYKEIL